VKKRWTTSGKKHYKPQVKICVICGKEFSRQGRAKTCSEECRKLYKQKYNKVYWQKYTKRKNKNTPSPPPSTLK